MSPQIESFFDPATWTFTHVVHTGVGSHAAIIDSVLDFDPKSGRTSTASADKVITFVRAQQLTIDWILETHAHADHLSAAPYLRRELGGKIAIGANIRTVQGVFKKIFNLEPEFRLDGSQFDQLFHDGERFRIGELEAEVMFVPGHTPACAAYRIGDVVFVGDPLFQPDVGTARCDFPGGDADTLFQSIGKLLALPPQTKLYMCHDYPPDGREVKAWTTVAEERARNVHVHEGVARAAFVDMRRKRDATLAMPTLLLPSIQVNIRAGELPPPEDNGVRYLKLPLNAV